MEKDKKKIILISIGVILLITLVVGLSYAMYTFTGSGTKENVIQTGHIVITFNDVNNISIQNRYPETDSEGLANTDTNSQMTFTVTSDITGDTKVNYALGITDIQEGATLTQDYIKIYLKKGNNVVAGFAENKGELISSFKPLYIENVMTSHVLLTDVISGSEVHTYTLKAWIDENYKLPKTESNTNGTHTSNTTSETFTFKIKGYGTTESIEISKKVNEPELDTSMLAVYYDETSKSWKKADSSNTDKNNKWYDYNKQMWANAVTVTEASRDTYLKASIGTPISMDDITTMFVWIPRYEYKYNNLGDKYAGGTPDAPGEIMVNFITKNTTSGSAPDYIIHPAFKFGGKELSGIWVGKFALGTSDATMASTNLNCTDESCSVSNLVVKPNVNIQLRNNVSSLFFAIRSMQYTDDINLTDEVDMHMIKNSEWGAVAYLAQSKYGKYGNNSYSQTEKEVTRSYYWEGTAGLYNNVDDPSIKGEYDTSLGQKASTTGNIYGIYDMTNNLDHYVMAYYTTQGTTLTENSQSGFTGNTLKHFNNINENNKYIDYYTSRDIKTACNNGICYGHALSETENWYGSTYTNSSWLWGTRRRSMFTFLYMDGGSYSSYKTQTTHLVITN